MYIYHLTITQSGHTYQKFKKKLKPPFILLGDFNAHNKIWSPERPNNRGNIIENVLLTANITLLNTPGVPTYFNSATGSFSTIDLTFSDPHIASSLHWETLDSLYDSDHFPVIVKTANNSPQQNTTHLQWNIRNTTQWSSYSQ